MEKERKITINKYNTAIKDLFLSLFKKYKKSNFEDFLKVL